MMASNLYIQQGDITNIRVDAIVNAANSSLMGGGGVDGAIHRAGGPAILEACNAIVAKQGGCSTGEAVITTAGRLPARFVIHTVGPIWRGGQNREPELLRNCYLNSLRLAIENECTSIAFPNISTGVYHFPKDRAATISIDAIRSFLIHHPELTVFIVCFDEANYQIMSRLMS